MISGSASSARTFGGLLPIEAMVYLYKHEKILEQLSIELSSLILTLSSSFVTAI